jgi:hypothetical protein
MTTSSRRALGAALLLLTFAFDASAQTPSAADLESARELYKEAKVLRDKGDLRGALEKFKQAHAYGQTPVTALELGRTHMQLGELVEARELFLSVGRMKVQSDETDKSTAARKEADDLAEQVRSRIPTLNIKVTGVPADAQPQVTVDGANIPVVSLTAIRKTNPGPHVVVAKLGTKEQKSDVTLAERETKDVSIALDGVAEPPPPPPPPGGDHKPETGGRSISPVTWIGLGLGVAGLGVGSVAGVIALGKSKTVKDECVGTACPTKAKSDVDSGRTAATISTIGFIAGGVGVAVAAVGFFFLSSSSTATGTSVRPVVGASYLGLDGRF